MNIATLIQKQLLATKFFVPVTPGTLISRPRLIALLDKGLKHPFTLVSAPAGFGKTTLLSTWAHSLQAPHARLCWISLDEQDNDPRLFWTYVLTALDGQGSQRFEPLLMHLQSQPPPPLKPLLTALVNRLAESEDHFVLILDDYQLITEEQVHTTLAYLLERLPAQLRIVLSTRADPPLPLPLLRARQRALEVRTEQLRCTVEETGTFLEQVMGIQFPAETIQQVTVRTEGWLVGLQLLALSLQGNPNPTTLLEETSGDQRYILDYLTEEVLRRQSQQMQSFLLCTSILERLTAPLCDAIMEQPDSQQMLRQLEQANLFVVSLDSRREWYRYHGLFAQALCYQLEQTQPDLLPSLHHRASLWYANHNQPTQAILHALHAKEWPWAADLIEQQSAALNTLTWGISKRKVLLLRDWFQQIPVDILHTRPRLCLAYTWMLLFVTPQTVLETRLNAVQTLLTAQLRSQTHQENSSSAMLIPPARQELEKLLGEVIAYRALIRSYDEDGEAALPLCQQAQALLSADNALHGHIGVSKLFASYASCINDATAAIQMGLQAASLRQAAGNTALAISIMGETALHMIGTGHLHQTRQLTQQAIVLGRKPGTFVLPMVGWPMLWQAEVLREWNQLEAAHALAEEGIGLCEQMESPLSLIFSAMGYAMLLRVCLSRGKLDEARSALQEFERLGMSMNQRYYLYLRSHFTTIDQVRLWLACGELDRATHWLEQLDLRERHGTAFAREREEVACGRVLLAQNQPALALQRLSPVLQRAIQGQRWGHVIEMQLLQALAYQMGQQEKQALDALSEAVRLAEPEGSIRSFVDEGAPMEALLYRLQQEQGKDGPTPYLDTVLAAFPQQSKPQEHQPKRAGKDTKTQSLLEPLSKRELEVLQLLARGASNLEIAHELVIVVDTVKRHISHIFAKLDVQNRVQAARRARELSLLDEEHL
jgi:LuxR family maltose regulon positive regulatory protein